ncbi:hypothetical protein B9Q02_04985 [Candidatus Marsarchaeota G1 archaeon BE_D]|uniref:Uncharacterized protein n=1 Tax=Candidatus Marsarchaeota G1 archaeon BE_D TaxID=1978156 RepID=A0A2R6AHG9_9ARCH|nr:MAG: hypothetical protein B9Q02_04985 [Candidatus Marsarchaeota G1 archaeon BE_D]
MGHTVKGEKKSIQTETSKRNKSALIDLGINVLVSMVVDDGTWLLYKGVRRVTFIL